MLANTIVVMKSRHHHDSVTTASCDKPRLLRTECQANSGSAGVIREHLRNRMLLSCKRVKLLNFGCCSRFKIRKCGVAFGSRHWPTPASCFLGVDHKLVPEFECVIAHDGQNCSLPGTVTESADVTLSQVVRHLDNTLA